MKKMKKQHKVFSTAKKTQILATADAHVGTRVDLAAMLGLSVLTLNTTVSSKGSEIGKSYWHCGPSFSKETKSLKTLSMDELETILLAWFMQACTTNASTDGPQLKKNALHAAVHRRYGWILDFRQLDRSFNKIHNLVYKSMLGESAIVNPNTAMDWKKKSTALMDTR